MIPTFNERENLIELVRKLTLVLDPKLGDDYELVIVDDDSPDRTWELAAPRSRQRWLNLRLGWCDSDAGRSPPNAAPVPTFTAAWRGFIAMGESARRSCRPCCQTLARTVSSGLERS